MATSPDSLNVIRGVGAAWPLQAYTNAGTAATGVFTGSEALSAEVFYGNDAALPVTPLVAWIDGPSGQYLVSISAAQSAALAPGPYTLVISAAGASAPLLIISLVVEPAPTDGSDLLRSLAQPADFLSLVSAQKNNPAVPAALQAATRAIEAYCRRKLVLDSYDILTRPGRTRRIYLDARPVVGEPVLTYNLVVCGTIWNTDISTNQQASVSMTPASATSGQAAKLTLRRTASGVEADNPFTLSDYATISALFDAISAVGGGWQAITPGFASTADRRQILLLPTSRLLFDMGRKGALNQQVELRAYSGEITDYDIDPMTGVIELAEDRPEAFRYGDRSFSQGFGWSWSGAGQPLNANVRIQYRGGYAISQADMALGYLPVPEDLKMACCLTAMSVIAAPSTSAAIQSQSINTQKLVVRPDAPLIPKAARLLLRNYESARFGGWM